MNSVQSSGTQPVRNSKKDTISEASHLTYSSLSARPPTFGAVSILSRSTAPRQPQNKSTNQHPDKSTETPTTNLNVSIRRCSIFLFNVMSQNDSAKCRFSFPSVNSKLVELTLTVGCSRSYYQLPMFYFKQQKMSNNNLERLIFVNKNCSFLFLCHNVIGRVVSK